MKKTKTKDLRNALKESRLAAAKCEGFNTTSTAALIDTILSEEETEDERKSDSQSASSLNAKSTIMSPTASPSSSFTRGRTKRSTRSLSLQPGMEHSRHTSSVGLGSVDEYEENDFGVSPRQSSVSVADAVVDDLEKGGDKPDYVGDHLGDQVRLAELRGIEVGLKAGMDRMKQRLVTTSELHATEMQALKGQYDRVRERLESSNELLTKEVESLKKELQTEEMTNVGRMRGEMTRQMEEKYEQKELQLRREFEDHLREVRNNHLKEISALEKSKYIKSFTAPVLTVEPVGLLMEESTQTDDSLFPLQPSTRSGISASSEQLLVPRASAGGLAAPHKVSSPCSPNPNAEETPQPSDAAEASSAVLEAAAAFRAKKKTRDVGTQHAVEMAFSWIAFVDRILAASDGDEEREESKVRVRAEVDAGKVGEQRVTVTYDLLAELIEATTSDDVIIEDNIMEAIDTNDSKRIISLFQGRQKVIQFERGIIQNLMNDHEEQAKIQDEVWREKTKELHQEIVNLNSELEISKSELETAKGQLATFEHEMSRSRRTRGRRRTSRLRSSLGKPKRASDVDETISEGSESDLVAPKPVSDPEVHVSPSSRDAKSTEQSVMAFVMTYHAEAQTSPTPGLEPLSLRRRKSITIDSLDLDENSRRRSIDMRSQPCPDSPEAAEGRSGAPRRRKVDRSQRAVRSLPGSRSGSRQTGRTDSRQPARPSSVRPANSQTHEGSRQAAKPQRGVGEGRSGAGPARTHGGQAKGKRRQVASARERGAHTHAGRTRQDGDGDEKPGKHSRGSGRLRRTTSSLLDYARSPEGAAALSNLDETTKRRHRALGRMLRSLARHSTMVGVDDEAVGESGCEKGDKRPKGLKTSKGEKGTTFKGKRRGTKIKRTKMFRGGVENKGCGEKRSTLGRDNGGENVIRESLLERLMERLSALRDVMEVPRRAFKIIARELGRLQCGACGARLYIPRNSIRQAYKKAVAVESVKLPDSSSVLFRGLGKLSCLSNDEFRKRLSGQVRGWRPSGVYRDARALTEGFPTKGRGAAVQAEEHGKKSKNRPSILQMPNTEVHSSQETNIVATPAVENNQETPMSQLVEENACELLADKLVSSETSKPSNKDIQEVAVESPNDIAGSGAAAGGPEGIQECTDIKHGTKSGSASESEETFNAGEGTSEQGAAKVSDEGEKVSEGSQDRVVGKQHEEEDSKGKQTQSGIINDCVKGDPGVGPIISATLSLDNLPEKEVGHVAYLEKYHSIQAEVSSATSSDTDDGSESYTSDAYEELLEDFFEGLCGDSGDDASAASVCSDWSDFEDSTKIMDVDVADEDGGPDRNPPPTECLLVLRPVEGPSGKSAHHAVAPASSAPPSHEHSPRVLRSALSRENNLPAEKGLSPTSRANSVHGFGVILSPGPGPPRAVGSVAASSAAVSPVLYTSTSSSAAVESDATLAGCHTPPEGVSVPPNETPATGPPRSVGTVSAATPMSSPHAVSSGSQLGSPAGRSAPGSGASAAAVSGDLKDAGNENATSPSPFAVTAAAARDGHSGSVSAISLGRCSVAVPGSSGTIPSVPDHNSRAAEESPVVSARALVTSRGASSLNSPFVAFRDDALVTMIVTTEKVFADAVTQTVPMTSMCHPGSDLDKRQVSSAPGAVDFLWGRLESEENTTTKGHPELEVDLVCPPTPDVDLSHEQSAAAFLAEDRIGSEATVPVSAEAGSESDSSVSSGHTSKKGRSGENKGESTDMLANALLSPVPPLPIDRLPSSPRTRRVATPPTSDKPPSASGSDRVRRTAIGSPQDPKRSIEAVDGSALIELIASGGGPESLSWEMLLGHDDVQKLIRERAEERAMESLQAELNAIESDLSARLQPVWEDTCAAQTDVRNLQKETTSFVKLISASVASVLRQPEETTDTKDQSTESNKPGSLEVSVTKDRVGPAGGHDEEENVREAGDPIHLMGSMMSSISSASKAVVRALRSFATHIATECGSTTALREKALREEAVAARFQTLIEKHRLHVVTVQITEIEKRIGVPDPKDESILRSRLLYLEGVKKAIERRVDRWGNRERRVRGERAALLSSMVHNLRRFAWFTDMEDSILTPTGPTRFPSLNFLSRLHPVAPVGPPPLQSLPPRSFFPGKAAGFAASIPAPIPPLSETTDPGRNDAVLRRRKQLELPAPQSPRHDAHRRIHSDSHKQKTNPNVLSARAKSLFETALAEVHRTHVENLKTSRLSEGTHEDGGSHDSNSRRRNKGGVSRANSNSKAAEPSIRLINMKW
eukprot:Rmarinus@m.13527